MMEMHQATPICKKWVWITLFLLINHSSLLAQERADAGQTAIDLKLPVVFVSQTSYAPFEFIDNTGEHTGMCIELIRWMSTELGFKTRFTDAPFKDAQEAVLSGQANVLTSFFYSDRRDAIFDFTQPVFQVPVYIFVAADRVDIKTLADLNGKTIAMQSGDYAQEFLESKNISFKVIHTRDFAEATDLVIAGKADTLIGDDPIVRFHLHSKQLTDMLKQVGDPLFIGQNAMAVKEGNAAMVALLNRGIALARNKGVLERISRKWLGVAYGAQASLWETYRLPLALSATSLGIVLVLVWLWNIRLRSEVDRKTVALRQSEEMLYHANKQWERTFDAVPDMISILDKDYRVLKMNRAMAAAFNVTGNKPNTLKCYQIVHDLEEPIAYCPHAKLLEDGREHTLELHDRRSGKDLYISVSPLADATGTLVGSVHVARDITERRRRERRLACLNTMREDLLRTTGFAEKMDVIRTCMKCLFGTAIYRIWMAAEAGDGTDGPARVAKRTSKTPETVENRSLELVAASGDPLAISADGWDGFESDCLSQLFVGDASPLMFDGQPIDGIPIHHRVAGYPIRSNTGKTIGAFLYIGEDPGRPPNNNLLATIVTALTYVFRAEIIANTLRESEKRHRQLFESLVDVYFRTDAAGTITMVSPSVESLMGFQPEAILGTQAVDHWADPQRLELFSRDLRDKGTLVNREERLRKKDGSSFWASCNATLLKDAGVEAMVRDVTEKKRSEAMLRKALEEKETLLREIHHRVKNNLAVVASMLNLQIKHNKNKVVQDSLEESRTRVHSMALIHETLYQTEDLSAVQLKDYVRKLMRDLLSVYDHGSVQITIDYDIGDLQLDLNQAVYCGLIINELATNAMKYAFVDKATGTIHISAKWNADNEINLSVKDDGVGLPASFDWHNTSTLGLRLISLMVEQLRGSLSFNSHNGLDAVIRWKSSLPAERPGTVS